MIKKRIAVIFMTTILTYILTGCVGVNLYGGETVIGKGEAVRRSFKIESFDSVEILGNCQIIYKNAPSDEFELEMQENLFEHISTTVQNGTLIFSSDKNIQTSSHLTPKLYISTPNFKKLIIKGALTIKESDKITGDQFHIALYGAGSVDVTIEVTTLTANLSGAGSVTLSGSADNAELTLSGTGNLDALDLDTRQADISISGVGNGSISCSEKLTVDISGVGNLKYKGDPEIIKNISGMGSLKKAST